MYVCIIQCSSMSCTNLQDKMKASIIDINKQHTNKIAQLTNELREPTCKHITRAMLSEMKPRYLETDPCALSEIFLREQTILVRLLQWSKADQLDLIVVKTASDFDSNDAQTRSSLTYIMLLMMNLEYINKRMSSSQNVNVWLSCANKISGKIR